MVHQQDRLHAARVATLFRFGRQVYVGGTAAGGLLVVLLWQAFPAALLLSWFAVLVAAMLARLAVHARFLREGDAAPLRWERRMSIATLFIAAVWAYVPAVLFPAGELLQAAVVLVVSIVVMTGAALYAASPRVVLAFVALPMAALAIALFLEPTFTHRVLAVAMAVFALVVLRAAAEIRRSLLEALRARLDNELVLDTLPVGVAFVARRQVVRCNRRLEQMLGYEPGELAGKSTRAWFRTDERWEAAGDETYSRLAGGEIMEGDAKLLRKDGSSLWCRVLARALDPAAPRESAIFAFADVTERLAAETALRESDEKLRLAVDAAGLVYWEWDRDTDRVTFEEHVMPWSEYRERVHPEDRGRYLAAVEEAWKEGGTYSAEYRVIDREGRVSWISARGNVVRDASGRARRMIGVAQDVTERREQEDTVRFLAYHDALTGLPNRRLLDDRLKQALYRAERHDGRVAVLLVDLDDFKQVNDTAGHRAGDAVLREVALRLAGCVRKADTLARHGGDEFVVVMADLGADSDAQAVAEKILRSLAPEFRVDGKAYSLGASIGIAVYPGDAKDGDGLLRNADVAMYRAKQLGRNQYRFFAK